MALGRKVLCGGGAVAQLSRMVDGFNGSETQVETLNLLFSQWSVAAAAAQTPSVYPPGHVWSFWSPAINLLSYNLRYKGRETLSLAESTRTRAVRASLCFHG